VSRVACDASLSLKSLYKARSGDRNSTLDTVLGVVGALDLKLRAEAAPASDAAVSSLFPSRILTPTLWATRAEDTSIESRERCI